MKKVILFDFGGTLDTDGIHWSEKFLEVYHHFNISVSRELFKEAFVYSERKIADIIKSDFDLKSTFNEQIKNQLEFLEDKVDLDIDLKNLTSYLSNYCYVSVTENVKTSKKILEQLDDKFTLGLVSNYYGNVRTVLQELSLEKYFSTIIDSTIVGVRKPDPEIFRLAINNLETDPLDTIVIGDSYNNDIAPAKLLGCSTIWIKNKTWNNSDDMHSADIIIDSIRGLPEILYKIK